MSKFKIEWITCPKCEKPIALIKCPNMTQEEVSELQEHLQLHWDTKITHKEHIEYCQCQEPIFEEKKI